MLDHAASVAPISISLKARPMRYQTEIHVTDDRYVCLQLPSHFPEGRAVVTVTVAAEDLASGDPPTIDDADRQDIEWWDEFDEEPLGRRA